MGEYEWQTVKRRGPWRGRGDFFKSNSKELYHRGPPRYLTGYRDYRDQGPPRYRGQGPPTYETSGPWRGRSYNNNYGRRTFGQREDHRGHQGQGPRHPHGGNEAPEPHTDLREVIPRGKGPNNYNNTSNGTKSYASVVAAKRVQELQKQRENLDKELRSLEGNQANRKAPIFPSSNNSFSDIVKSSYRFVQMRHHLRNWEKVPKGITLALKKVVQNVKPPMPGQALNEELNALVDRWGEMIAKVVTDHLHNKLDCVQGDLLQVDPRDSSNAIKVANRQLQHKLGKKVSAPFREEALNQVLDIVGSNFKKSTLEPTIVNNLVPATSSPVPAAPISGKGPAIRRLVEEYKSSPGKKRKVVSSREDDDDLLCIEMTETNRNSAPPTKVNSDLPKVGSFKDTRGNVIIRSKYDDSKIYIDSSAQCLLIGDSNVQKLKDLHPSFRVISVRGATLSHLTQTFKLCSPLPSSINSVIFAGGINYKESGDIDKDFAPDLESLLETSKSKMLVTLMQVSIPDQYTGRWRSNLERINQLLEDIQPTSERCLGILKPLPKGSVKTIEDGVHYDGPTLERLADHILDAFFQ